LLEAIDNLERLVVKLLKHPATLASMLIVAALEILLAILTWSAMPKLDSMSDQIAWEIGQLRMIYLPAVVALYVLSAIYVVHLARLSPKAADASPATRTSPAAIVLAAIITLALDSIAYTLVPVGLNFTLALSVLERSFAVFGITAVVLALCCTIWYGFARNAFLFVPLLFACFFGFEYLITKLSFEHSEWYFLNDLYFWNLVNPTLKTPVMGSLDPPQVYVITGYTIFAVTFFLVLIRLFHGAGRR
jgi:hypothetical protein